MSTIPTITATLNLQVPANIVIDLNTVWLSQKTGPTNTLAAALADTDATLTLAHDPGTSIPGASAIAVGSVLLIDQEPMVVAAVSGLTVTVTRAATAFPFLANLPTPPAATHTTGVNVYALTFSSPWDMLASLALRPWVQQQINALGANSVTFGTTVSGTLTLPS